MDNIDLKQEVYERTVELFYEPEEEVYSTRPHFPRPYPLLYLAYDLSSAAIDAMAEWEECQTLSGLELLRMRDEIVSRVEESTDMWAAITLGRMAMAQILNHYGGPERPFCPN
jgi:hypothetical protein